jgi:glycosyltransferase involved in cell wall biosynthesis
MKIVLPVHHFPPRYSAGAELYTFRLARWLQAHGHQVEVVCVEAIDRGGPGELQVVEDRYEGIAVQRLSFDMVRANDYRWSYDNPLLREWFAAYLAARQPDIVHCQAGYLIGAAPLHAAVAAGIPTVLTLHDYWFLCPRITLQRGDGALCETIPADPAGCAWCMRLESRRYRLPDQISYGLAGRAAQALALSGARREIADRRVYLLPALALPGAVIAPSRFLAERYAPFVAPDRLHISRYGLDLAPFQSRHRPQPDGTLRIGFTGQIAPHKGVHLLVEALRALQTRGRPVELHIYGGLEARPDYVARLRRLAGDDRRIQLHGRFENSRVAEILMGLDVAVVPSIWYENSPLAIMEAHAAGTPVVTAALGGMAELVRDGVDGLHFKAVDSADLTRQLQRLLDEPELLLSLRSGVTMPRDIEDEMLQLVAIYQRLVPNQVAALDAVFG